MIHTNMFHDIAACDEIVYSARATFARIHIKFGDTEAPPKRSKTLHAATPEQLMARWHDFKSIKLATNLISFWPLCYRFDQVPTKTSKQKQTESKQWYEQIWFVLSFWEDAYLCELARLLLRRATKTLSAILPSGRCSGQVATNGGLKWYWQNTCEDLTRNPCNVRIHGEDL